MTSCCNTNPCLRDVVTETQHCILRLKQTLHCHLMQLRELGIGTSEVTPSAPVWSMGKALVGALGTIGRSPQPKKLNLFGHLGHAS